MMSRLRIVEPTWMGLRRHMAGEIEQAAFLLLRGAQGALIASDLRCLQSSEIDCGPEHLLLPDEVRQEMIAWAWREQAGLLEAHFHPYGDPAAFSPFDVRGLGEWVPHVRWRLAGAPYLALVFAPASFDALIFAAGSEHAAPLSEVIVGTRRLLPTGATYRQLSRSTA